MGKLEVKITSQETIKPSSPTPNHLQSMPLSIAEQLSPFEYIRVLLFYSGDLPAGDKAALLKASLSKTLTHFYPLAGRIQEPDPSTCDVVDCKDQGAEFFEAKVEGELAGILNSPPVDELKQLLPNCGNKVRYGDPLLLVQLNEFAGDGGSVIGLCLSHQITDGHSMAMFVKYWSDVARVGAAGSRHPLFHSATVFPPMSQVSATVFENDVGAVARNFVISATAMEKLKGDAYAREQPPTRVEAVSTLIWRCVARARRQLPAPASSRSLGATYSVNMRSKMSGRLTDESFGSLFCVVFLVGEQVIGAGGDISDEGNQGVLEKSAREAIAKVDEDYIRGLAAAYVAERASGESGVGVGGLGGDFLMFSSWCRFPLYEADFGWGTPAWASCVHRDTKDAVILMDTPDGKGIEVWMCLAAEVVEELEKDEEFLRFASTQSGGN